MLAALLLTVGCKQYDYRSRNPNLSVDWLDKSHKAVDVII